MRSATGHRREATSPRFRQLRGVGATRGWRVGRIFEESFLEQALGRIESQESNGLLVPRLSDLGSSLGEVIAVIERIHAAGGMLVSAGDGIVLTPHCGRLILRVLLSVIES